MYYNEDGFGSFSETAKDAENILNSVTINDVKVWMEEQAISQLKAYKNLNSYVAHHPLQEVQIYIGDFTESGAVNKRFRYAFVAINIFTKLCHVVPIQENTPDESIRAMKGVLEK